MFIASEFRFGGCRFKPDSVPWNSRYSIYCIPLARPFVIAFIVFPRPLQFFVSMLSPRQSPAPLFWIADAVGLGTGCRNMIGHWLATLLKSWVNAPTLSKCLIAKNIYMYSDRWPKMQEGQTSSYMGCWPFQHCWTNKCTLMSNTHELLRSVKTTLWSVRSI